MYFFHLDDVEVLDDTEVLEDAEVMDVIEFWRDLDGRCSGGTISMGKWAWCRM